MCCCSPEARARKQARKQVRKAAFVKLVQSFGGSSSNSRTLAPHPNGPTAYGTTRASERVLCVDDVTAGTVTDEKAPFMMGEAPMSNMGEPPTYGEVMGEGQKDVK